MIVISLYYYFRLYLMKLMNCCQYTIRCQPGFTRQLIMLLTGKLLATTCQLVNGNPQKHKVQINELNNFSHHLYTNKIII